MWPATSYLTSLSLGLLVSQRLAMILAGACRNAVREKRGWPWEAATLSILQRASRERCALEEALRLVMLLQERGRGELCAINPELWYLWNEKKKKRPQISRK